MQYELAHSVIIILSMIAWSHSSWKAANLFFTNSIDLHYRASILNDALDLPMCDFISFFPYTQLWVDSQLIHLDWPHRFWISHQVNLPLHRLSHLHNFALSDKVQFARGRLPLIGSYLAILLVAIDLTCPVVSLWIRRIVMISLASVHWMSFEIALYEMHISEVLYIQVTLFVLSISVEAKLVRH